MIILTESIKRTLERIGQTIENDLNNGIIYPLYSEKHHELLSSTEEYLVNFRKFKWSLESGKHELFLSLFIIPILRVIFLIITNF